MLVVRGSSATPTCSTFALRRCANARSLRSSGSRSRSSARSEQGRHTRMFSIRQSTLRVFDRCPLAAKWEMEIERPWNTAEQALGTVFHGVVHEMLRTMRSVGAKRIPTEEAIVIMYEVCALAD